MAKSTTSRKVQIAAIVAFGLSLAGTDSISGQSPSSGGPPSEDILVQRAIRLTQAGRARYFTDIEQKLESGDFGAADALATAAIDSKDDGTNPQLAAYVRSLAFLHRAEARLRRGFPEEQVNADVAAAAGLGNLVAIRQLVRQYVQSARDSQPASARPPVGVAIDEVLRAGMDLGDRTTLQAVANGFGAVDQRQRTLAELLYGLQTKDSGVVRRIDRLARETNLSDLLTAVAFVGGPRAGAAADLSSRDLLATLVAEDILRGTLARGLGFALPEKSVDPPLSLREIIELNNWLGEMTGMATVYHFVPESAPLGPRVLEMSRRALGNTVATGDSVHVRCGALAHTAVVWSVDRGRDELLLLDPLFQYWQPSHNDCITTFSLVHFRYGYYLTKLKLTEVLPMIDAVQALRTYEPPGWFDQLAGSADASRAATAEIQGKKETRCAGEADAKKPLIGQSTTFVLEQDLFTFFNLRQEGAGTLGENGLTTLLFLPAALQFRGDVAVAMKEADQCTRSLSLFLRRSFLSGANGVLAADLLRSFLRQSFGTDEVNAWNAIDSSNTGRNESASARLAAVLREPQGSVTFKGPRLTAFVGNVVSEAGARWVRVDGW
jgi:hypothetical protein